MKKAIILMIFLSMITLSISGQTSHIDSKTSDEIKRHVQEKVSQLTDYISLMADKRYTSQDRYYTKKQALNLFVAKGESYEIDGNIRKGVIMETTSLYRKNPLKRLMKDYFDGVINYKYSTVEISKNKWYEIKVSDLILVDNNLYKCTACFEQTFEGRLDGRTVYKDKTKKDVEVFIEIEETMDGYDYIIKLGDVTAKETRKY